MKKHVCPWWIGYLLASPARKLVQNPREILRPYVSEGMTVFEPGPGMGFFTLELARLVGPTGRVVAVDIQAKMLSGLMRRGTKAGLHDRIETRLSDGNGLGADDLKGKVDFILAFAMVHELPDQSAFFREAASMLKPGGRLLFSEPLNHVDKRDFEASVAMAAVAGLSLECRPEIKREISAVLKRG
jgi:ubiquinone/menaquinone biosynthesis C-methylase UbiE